MNNEKKELDDLMRTTAGCMKLMFPKGNYALIIRLQNGDDVTLGNKSPLQMKSLFRRGLAIMTAKVKETKK